MGYGIAIVGVVIVIFLLVAATKRSGGSASGGGKKESLAHGLSAAGPASDQPTPRAGRTVNSIGTDAARKIPPG